MAGPARRRWFRWTGEIANWAERRAERSVGSPEEGLTLAENRLAKSLSAEGPDAWRTINAMESVARFRERLGRYSDALPLRRQVVDARRSQLGTEDRLTLAAEARLAITLIELREPSEAKPLLAHVLGVMTEAQGSEDVTVLTVMERLADAEIALGESEPARRLLEEAMTGHRERGDEVQASGIATKLAKSFIDGGHYSAATVLMRWVVEVRSRVLGANDPATLASLRNLVSALVFMGEFAEASIVARSLQSSTLRALGAGHRDTVAAQRLVRDIDERLDAD